MYIVFFISLMIILSFSILKLHKGTKKILYRKAF